MIILMIGMRRQTNATSSQFAAIRPNLRGTKLAPLSKSGGSIKFELVSALENAVLIEVIVDGGVNGDEFLQTSQPKTLY